MARKLTVAAAQTGPVLDGMEEAVEAACAMVQGGCAQGGRYHLLSRGVSRAVFSQPADPGLREAFPDDFPIR